MPIPTTSIFLLTLVSIFPQTLQQCNPYYPRMFYNPQAQQINTFSIDMIFMFNTNNSCPFSYVQLTYNYHIHSFRCSEKRIQTFQNGEIEFINFVQSCNIYVEETYQIQSFKYRIFGANNYNQTYAISSHQFIVELPTKDYPFRVAVIADWGPIIVKPYKPLNNTLDYILKQRVLERTTRTGTEWRVNSLFINGDYAYNLETDHCQMYLLFLNQLSRVSKFWPIMTTVGNHQSMEAKSMYLFQNSFVIGKLSTANGRFERVQKFRFTNRTTFLFFDPYLQVYKIGTQQKYDLMKIAIQKQLIKSRKLYPDEFMIVASHYPLKCSQVDPHCDDTMQNMPDLFEFLSTPFQGKGLVDLYIGSHMHQYERFWPFVNNKFINESSPYYRGRMANFVQAVGGMNYWITQEYYKPSQFSVFSTYNITGMGIMTVQGRSDDRNNKFEIRYKHIITPKTYEVIDKFVVTNKYKNVSDDQSLKYE